MTDPLLQRLHKYHAEALASLSRLADWFDKKWTEKEAEANAMPSAAQAAAFRMAAYDWHKQACALRSKVAALSFLPREADRLKELIG